MVFNFSAQAKIIIVLNLILPTQLNLWLIVLVILVHGPFLLLYWVTPTKLYIEVLLFSFQKIHLVKIQLCILHMEVGNIDLYINCFNNYCMWLYNIHTNSRQQIVYLLLAFHKLSKFLRVYASGVHTKISLHLLKCSLVSIIFELFSIIIAIAHKFSSSLAPIISTQTY